MGFKWRKWNRAVHRDFGYFFLGMIIIYSISGIAVNHLEDWDPRYIHENKEIRIDPQQEVSREYLKEVLARYGEEGNYRKHFVPNDRYIKIFIIDGEVLIDRSTGIGTINKKIPRFLFKETTDLHYDPMKWWTWYSDIFAGALIFLAISGLFILKGKKGVAGRGAWLTILGIVIPIIFVLVFYKII
ncbi:MAG: PepSY-associated TM helix domain-containing protein [Bacteroidota bacterium]|nr:PepSY-associated TM helix domain-containing protein [Bacteroidota bacterium]